MFDLVVGSINHVAAGSPIVIPNNQRSEWFLQRAGMLRLRQEAGHDTIYFHSRANCRARWRTGSLRVSLEEMALSHSDWGLSWSRRK